ncbi:unnamed protein product, partial [Tetraodon nigroviridis]
FNGEPHSYTRFNLTQNMEGENSQVEMKLSTEDEEVGGNGVGEHLNHNSARLPSIAQRLGRTPKNLCCLAATGLLVFIIGSLIGYLVQSRKAPNCLPKALGFEDTLPHEDNVIPLMDWEAVKTILNAKVSKDNFEMLFADLSSSSHQAGSPGDETLANKVLSKFKDYGMKTWSDEHFVKVQDPPRSGFNSIVFKDGNEERPSGFLSYSACGRVMGAVLYGHYGQESDLMMLQNKNLDLSGRVLLLRAGRNSFAEKVANAAKLNASAVLIYPDPADYALQDTTELFGHVHLGSGDPYTPGFPSFNHTQFPPVVSSGLPKIPAQTITAGMASKILRQLGGPVVPAGWTGALRLGDEKDIITMEVSNVLTEKKISNVFGVIKGIVDSDRYLVIGAQRDAWGSGFAKSTVGTSVLLELARSISEMMKEGFKPRRSILFASWSAGEYGSVGATEWLEAYLSSLSMKAFSYINLDSVIAGQSGFKVAASPLMHSVVVGALKEVHYSNPDRTLYDRFTRSNWESDILEPLKLDNAAYPFLAFSGIPSVSFGFTSGYKEYPYFGTLLDTKDSLEKATNNQVHHLAQTVTRFAGHMALRLVHDHLLRVDLTKYDKVIRSAVSQINMKVKEIKRVTAASALPRSLDGPVADLASGAYSRASRSLAADIKNSNLDDIEMCRTINDRIMAVERNFLSPYVSPRERPFRHILLGSGPHTLKGLRDHLDSFQTNSPEADADLFRNQFALATWTIQGCANSLAGNF